MGWARGRQRVRTMVRRTRRVRPLTRSGLSEDSAGVSSRVVCASPISTPDARTTGGVLTVAGSPSTSITETLVRPAMRNRIHAAHRIGTAREGERRPFSGCLPAVPLTTSLLHRSLPHVNRVTWRGQDGRRRRTDGPGADSSDVQRKSRVRENKSKGSVVFVLGRGTTPHPAPNSGFNTSGQTPEQPLASPGRERGGGTNSSTGPGKPRRTPAGRSGRED